MTAFQLGLLVHAGDLGALLGEIEEQILTDIGVSHLAAAEADSDLHTIAVGQELLGVAQLGVKVADVDAGGHTNFLDLHDVLVLLGFFLALGLLELELTVVHELADRGDGVGRDLNQIQTGLIGKVLGIGGRHDTELFTGIADQSDFTVADLFVHLISCVRYVEAPPS